MLSDLSEFSCLTFHIKLVCLAVSISNVCIADADSSSSSDSESESDDAVASPVNSSKVKI